MKIRIGAFLGGTVFGIGLAIGGMTQPAKVVGFFDFFGSWDPSLAFVMGGALLVYTPVYRWAIRTWQRPIWAPSFSLPTRKDIDGRLIVGSGIFGVGWGLGGYCPGPALTSVGAGSHEALIFGFAMLAGVGGYQIFMRVRDGRARGRSEQVATVIDG
ncbi:MAG: DUF6691 family protein [Polyangiales bacterium]